MRDVLSLLLDDFIEKPIPSHLRRLEILKQAPGKASVVMGMRRSGKTWFCYQQMASLLAQGIPKRRLYYLNFEDERLSAFQTSDFQTILDVYFERFPDNKKSLCYFFLDEIHRVPGWELFCRRVLDNEHISLVLTGSSSKLLSAEIATELRGRSLSTEIFPFSFREFLEFHGVSWDETTWGSKTKAELNHQLERYLAIGGFPEIQRLEAPLQKEILRNYLDVAILRDVIERHSLRNTLALRALVSHLVHSPAQRMSVNKFYNDLKSQGVTATKNDLYGFIDHLKDAYLIFSAALYARSERKKRVNPPKIYEIDTGLLKAVSSQITEDRGALFENAVYLHFRRQGFQPFTYMTQSGAEVDFVVMSKETDEKHLIQVSWDLKNQAVRDREFFALKEAMKELKVKKGTMVTRFDENTRDAQVAVIPAIKFFLSPLR